MRLMRVLTATLLMIGSSSLALAQITPAAGYTPPDDTPSIRVGVLIYADWSVQTSPEIVDADGNTIKASAFNVTRSYINVTGQISHIVAFRVTPDVVRETNTASAASGSLIFRVKYAYAQFNLDDWMPKGTYARPGIQQTPWIDYDESIYRYRFQGTPFVEREGYFASADAGASFHYQVPNNYGEVHVGYYNGENFNRAETNDQKALMIRATLRPFAAQSLVPRGLRVSVFYDSDHYVKDAERTRFIAAAHYEHPYVNAGFYYLDTHDQQSVTRPTLSADVEGKGYTVWATPKTTKGWEALLRYDHLTPNELFGSQLRSRTIVGGAYWFPHQGTVTAALMLDYDGQTFDNFVPAQPKNARVALHGLISF